MSTNAATAQPQALHADDAYAVVHQRVYAPVFFEKLASAEFGFKPKTEEEAFEMLQMASSLRIAHDDQQAKQAQANGSLIGRAAKHLNTELEKRGYEVPKGTPKQETLRKQAAANGARDPELARAIISLQIGAAGANAA